MPDISPMDLQAIQASAIRLLAMREHSRYELSRKLQAKFPEESAIDQVLDELEQQGLLSDERFVEQYIRMRIRKGYGPLRIRAELQERRISSELIQIWLDDDADSWFLRLQEVAQLKYDQSTDINQREQSRRARFLHSRGYPESLIRRYLWD